MIIEIGIVAGEILDLLEEKKIPMSIREIQFYLEDPIDVINMAAGWLIRENYVHTIRGSQKYLFLVPNDVFFRQAPENTRLAANI